MSRLPLGALPGFVAVIRHGGLSGAARSLNLTVSALSHQMNSLERRLRLTLFERSPAGLRPTHDGRRLHAEIAPHFEAIERALRPSGTASPNALTLTTLPSFANGWLMARLPGFLAAHPQIQLSVTSSVALVDFAREDIDAGLRYGTGDWPDLVVERLFAEWLVPVVAPQLRRTRRGRAARIEDLPRIGDPDGLWDRWYASGRRRPSSREVLNLDNSEARMWAAAEGVGVALAAEATVQPLLTTGRLVRMGRRRLPAERAYYLVYPKRTATRASFIAFREWLFDVVRRTAR